VGNDIAGEILRLARFENVTQIVVGRSRVGFFAVPLAKPIAGGWHAIPKRFSTAC
jgi:hypothetical protein